MAKPVLDADVVIVGAGMVGATLALALARSGLRLALVDRGAPPRDAGEGDYDLRVSAVGRGSQRVLDSLGVWSAIGARRVAPFRKMFVWDEGSSGSIRFDSAELAEPYLGHIVENQVITHCLHDSLSTHAGARLVYAVEPERIAVHDAHVSLSLGTGDTLRARVLVGADGSRSWVRDQLEIGDGASDYDQRALVAEIDTDIEHRDTAWQRFLATGPLAFLPLANGHCSIVWSCDDPLAAELLELDDEAFNARLGQAFAHKLGEVRVCGPRRAFPLRCAHSDSYLGPRSVLIGDAAHTVHPLAGQGANLGIADAAALAETLVDAFVRDADIGGRHVLRRYERWRKGENLAVLQTMDGFKKLFGQRSASLRRLRGIGLDLVDAAAPVKHYLARRAMGLAGDLPRLARGLKLATAAPDHAYSSPGRRAQ